MIQQPQHPLNIMIVLGTRPEATKLAPVILELRRFPAQFNVQVVSTGQHREMLPQTLGIFGLAPDVDLDIMQPRQSLEHITSAVLSGLDRALSQDNVDLLLVEGDTTSVFVGALAAFYKHIPVAHLEAGLRTDDIYNPFPEEANRRLASVLSTIHLAPTLDAKQNLLREAIPTERIYVTGNTSVDAVLWAAEQPAPSLPDIAQTDRKIILVTAHRRENWGEPLQRICTSLVEITKRHNDAEVLFALHPNPIVRETAASILAGADRIHCFPAPEYLTFVHLMKRAHIMLTDSGGLQEEAPSLDKPVLVLRENTERPEGVAVGTSKLVGTDPQTILHEVGTLLTDETAYRTMAQTPNPFGDGHASERVRLAILHHFGLADHPQDFAL